MAALSRIRTKRYGKVVVVEFIDSAITDFQQIADISDDLSGLVENGDVYLILDFSNVKFLSSQALGMIIKLRHRVDEKGGFIILVGLRKNILKIFKLTRMDRLFPIYNTRDEALAEGYIMANKL